MMLQLNDEYLWDYNVEVVIVVDVVIVVVVVVVDVVKSLMLSSRSSCTLMLYKLLSPCILI